MEFPFYVSSRHILPPTVEAHKNQCQNEKAIAKAVFKAFPIVFVQWAGGSGQEACL